MPPPSLFEGTVWPGTGPPRGGPPGAPSPACSLQKLRANREVPVQIQQSRKETLGLRAEGASTGGGGQGWLKTSPACSVTLAAWPWPPTCHCCSSGSRVLARGHPPALYPGLHLLPPLHLPEDTAG